MRRSCIINFFLALTSFSANAQKAMPDSLLYYEWQFYNGGQREEILLNKLQYQLQLSGFNEAYPTALRIKPEKIGDPAQRVNFYHNAALLAYLNNDEGRCRLFLDKLEQEAGKLETDETLLQILANRNHDTDLVRQKINILSANDTIFSKLLCFNKLAGYERKHLNRYLISSAIIPGSGTALNGEPLRGALSLALSAASAYGIGMLWQYGLKLNAVFLGGNIGLKFYTGNIRLTKKAFERKEKRQREKLAQPCEAALKKVLEKYPLNWKGI